MSDQFEIATPIQVRVEDLPSDLRTRLFGDVISVTYLYWRSIWTGTSGFQGPLDRNAVYRRAHEAANPSESVRM